MIKYKLSLNIGLNNCKQEEEITIEELDYTEKEWEKLTEDEQQDSLQEYWAIWSENYIDGGWEEIT